MNVGPPKPNLCGKPVLYSSGKSRDEHQTRIQPGRRSDDRQIEAHPHAARRIQEKNPPPDDGVVNDSFGTVDIADSTGLDETKETGDAKRLNKNTHED